MDIGIAVEATKVYGRYLRARKYSTDTTTLCIRSSRIPEEEHRKAFFHSHRESSSETKKKQLAITASDS